jgi:hypothetical protein
MKLAISSCWLKGPDNEFVQGIWRYVSNVIRLEPIVDIQLSVAIEMLYPKQ